MTAANESSAIMGEAARSGSGLIPLPVKPVLRSPFALVRWELDRAMSMESSREIVGSFCGALLRHLGAAVDNVVVRDRLGVLALPKLPMSARPEAVAIGLLVPRESSEERRKRLDSSVCAVGEEGFRVAGRDLHLTGCSGSSRTGRWVGPSRVWTSITPWVSESDHADRSVERRRCLLESLAISLLGDGKAADQQVALESLIDGAQAHDEAWVPGIQPASRLVERRSGLPAHVRVSFRKPVEGPIIIGRDRLLGMGLLVPLDVLAAPGG